MSDTRKKFHDFALKSELFKGRSDWYFCFLKSEKIAHVVSVLAAHVSEDVADELHALRESAAALPAALAGVAAGDVPLRSALADIFSLIAATRLLVTQAVISKETGHILLEEYEALAEKLDAGDRISPFVTTDDFAVPLLPQALPLSLVPDMSDRTSQKPQKTQGSNKGHFQGHSERAASILAFVRSNNGVSIKDICRLAGPVVQNCSEKTVQRELTNLVRQGLVHKTGERRWSQYTAL